MDERDVVRHGGAPVAADLDSGNRRVPRGWISAGLMALCLVGALALAGCGSISSGSSTGSRSDGHYTVALSDSYIGNEWRKTMVKTWTDAAKAAKQQGLISSYRVDVTAENTATAQIAQIQSLILAGVNAINIDSASPTALNLVIQQACAAGVKVVVFDSLASAPCEYNLADPFVTWAKLQAQLVLQQMHYKGNLIIVQGVVGSAPNGTVMRVWHQILSQYPQVHVVATVDGENADSTTEQAIESVLPSQPTVNGVLVQVGADGVVSAFQALHRPVPAVDFDTIGSSLREWESLHNKSGFTTSAVLTDPGQGAASLWESLLLLQHKDINGSVIPHNLNWPLVVISQSQLSSWLKVTPPTGVASWVWTEPQTIAGIEANLGHRAVDPPPIPMSAP